MEGTQKIVTPRPAATVILIRDGHSGLEVLLGEKTSKVNFAAGAFVFPGGAVDGDDRRENFLLKSVLTDSEAAQHLGLSEGAINYWIAAIRECFEEVGILYANYSEDSKKSQNDLAMFRSEKRDELARGEINFHQALKEENLQLEIDKLQYFSRWVTHAGSPRRYDTRFFIARMPEGQSAQHDGGELVDHRWLTPNEALKLSGEGKLNLMFPTQKTIEKLAEFSEVEDALNYARSNLPVTPMTPRVSIGSEGNKLLLPGDYAYAEAGKLDPRQLGTVSYEIKAGEPVQLDRRVIRLTAPNPSVMTGP
ncbi:MAG: NUDIX hydrolase, partial [Burkholderiales bacterium]|nr:NUDIX hydrolase [Burkholderiales bacterium]